jgi:hypothetical protein
MHIIGTMFFLTVLVLTFGLIYATIIEYKDKVIGALLGRDISAQEHAVSVSYWARNHRIPQMRPASNEDFTLPLAA